MVKVGIIGGSGLDNPGILENFKEIDVNTNYGKPSDKLITGNIGNVEVVILPRHGKDHSIPPSQVNFRANIQALKDQGVDYILATTACGSLKEEIGRGDFVIVDQFIDFTKHRKITFFDDFSKGIKHCAMAEPFNQKLRKLLIETSKSLGFKTHEKGTVITIEGPRFSTKAESNMFRIWGADVINMSVAPEAALANEMEIPYAAIAMATDFDSWLETEEPVTWEEISRVMKDNAERVKKLLIEIIKKLDDSLDLRKYIRTVPNWSKEGVMFRDITTLLNNPKAFEHAVNEFAKRYKEKGITKVVGIESRGFIFGAAIAKELNVGFVPVRKPGKLPYETISEEYELEYGKDKVEMHKDAIKEGDKVLVVDDLVATAGTMLAACNLVKKLNGKIIECAYVIDLPDLRGKEKLENAGFKTFNLIEFKGD
ncbi:MAG: S-methyl-5'-thioadenosine phosphorylase [Nanoarchaeota archaeon]|nr:S-methyl-5'-thioadenosine phosphorylase [Nanoarchaeota archaeon]